MLRRSFWDLFLQSLPYFQGKLLKAATSKYYICKSYQYKIRFWKKIYNPSRIELFFIGWLSKGEGFSLLGWANHNGIKKFKKTQTW
jgi:hypothetical protein